MKEAVSFRLDSELMDFIRKEAEKDFRSVSNYIEMVLKKHQLEVEAQKNPGD